jgi:iron complex outermembrane receptor protein
VFLYKPIRSVELGLLTKYVGVQFLDNTSNRGRSIDPYFVKDIRMTYTLKRPWMREWNISLLLNNVLDVKYSSNGATYPYIAGGVTYSDNYYYPQAGRNVLMMVAMHF